MLYLEQLEEDGNGEDGKMSEFEFTSSMTALLERGVLVTAHFVGVDGG